MGRGVLLQAIRSQLDHGGNVFYCDTDCIATDSPMSPDKVGSDLGQWDLEAQCPASEISFFAPKRYSLAGQTKIKGIRKAQQGVPTYQQAQFENWQRNAMSRNPGRSQRLERSAFIHNIQKTVSDLNKKRRVVAPNHETLPWVLPPNPTGASGRLLQGLPRRIMGPPAGTKGNPWNGPGKAPWVSPLVGLTFRGHGAALSGPNLLLFLLFSLI